MPRPLLVALLLGLSGAAAAPPDLPPPFATPSVTRHPKVVGWPAGRTPTAPGGFAVAAFAREIESPRWVYVLPNGDVLVAQARTLPTPKKEPDPGEKTQLQEA